MHKNKAIKKLLSGSKNVRFDELAAAAKAFGFELARIRGSHHIFEHPAIPDILNLQDCGGQAKPYQVDQFLALVEQYNLNIQEEET